MSLPTDGLSAFAHTIPAIDRSILSTVKPPSKVKIRFTQKQFEQFVESVRAIEKISADEEVVTTIAKSLGNGIKSNDVAKLLFPPLTSSISRTEVSKRSPAMGGLSYVVKARPVTDKIRSLFELVRPSEDTTNLHYDQRTSTCIVDARKLLTEYFELRNLKLDNGLVIDDFIAAACSGTLYDMSNLLVEDSHDIIIPRNHAAKFYMRGANEIAIYKDLGNVSPKHVPEVKFEE